VRDERIAALTLSRTKTAFGDGISIVSELSQLDKSRATPAEQLGKRIEDEVGWLRDLLRWAC